MSVGKKKDKDNQGSSSGGEASANYMIGKGGEPGRSETERGATDNKVTSSQESIATQERRVAP